MKLELLNDTFEPGGTVPREYTCEGADQSPPLRWQEAPPECQSLALICDDPDAPTGPGPTGSSTISRPKSTNCRPMSRPTQPSTTAASTAGMILATSATMGPAPRPVRPIPTIFGCMPWIPAWI